jgi:hypothetical protein
MLVVLATSAATALAHRRDKRETTSPPLPSATASAPEAPPAAADP